MSDTLDGMRRIYEEALDLAARKNHDYGDAWRSNGWRGNLSRIFEKDQRLRTLLWNGNAPEARVTDEDVRQTAVDMLNTLTFFIMNLEAGVEWGHEMPFHHIGQPTLAPILPQPSVNMIDHDWSPPTGALANDGYFPEPDTGILEKVHSGLAGAVSTEAIAVTLEPITGQLPVREPGAELSLPESESEALASNAVGQKGKPSPVRRQPNRKP